MGSRESDCFILKTVVRNCNYTIAKHQSTKMFTLHGMKNKIFDIKTYSEKEFNPC